MSQSRFPEYYISYVVNPSRHHSFIVVSKKTEEKAPPALIASFGLYGRYDAYISEIITNGFISEPGRIRSEHYYDNRLISNAGNSDLVPLVGKSFVISQDIAISIVERGIKDAKIDQINPETQPKNIKDSKDPALTDQENVYRKWFLTFPNRNIQGGPRFNGRDFNCHKYALFILRHAGIRDSYLESFNFPPDSGDLGFIDLQHLNIEEKPSAAIVAPSGYDNIFYAQETCVQGAIALLKDYSAVSLFHLKRHYRNEVGSVLKDIEAHPEKYLDIAAIITAINERIPGHRYYGGSLQRRLDYLQQHCSKEEFDAVIARKKASGETVCRSSFDGQVS